MGPLYEVLFDRCKQFLFFSSGTQCFFNIAQNSYFILCFLLCLLGFPQACPDTWRQYHLTVSLTFEFIALYLPHFSSRGNLPNKMLALSQLSAVQDRSRPLFGGDVWCLAAACHLTPQSQVQHFIIWSKKWVKVQR